MRESFVRKIFGWMVSKLNPHILLLAVKRTRNLYKSKKSFSTKINPTLLTNGTTSFTSGFISLTKQKGENPHLPKFFM